MSKHIDADLLIEKIKEIRRHNLGCPLDPKEACNIEVNNYDNGARETFDLVIENIKLLAADQAETSGIDYEAECKGLQELLCESDSRAKELCKSLEDAEKRLAQYKSELRIRNNAFDNLDNEKKRLENSNNVLEAEAAIYRDFYSRFMEAKKVLIEA